MAAAASAALGLAGCSSAEPEPEAAPGEPAAAVSTPAPSLPSVPSSPTPPALSGPTLDRAVLERLATDARAEDSTCFAVAQRGELVGEWYWAGGAAEVDQEVFSVTKSVTSTLVGLAQADGDLSVEDPAATHVPTWAGTASAEVTVRDLLANVSGRFWSGESDYGSLFGAADRTAYAVGLDQQQPPGSTWVYNNAAIQTLDAVLRDATGQDPAAYAQERLFEPLGMDHTFLTPDASGRSTNVFFGMHSTCRDLLRFGQLFAQDGEWDGEQLLPAAWVADATGRSSQELNAGYGLLWWLNRSGPQVDVSGGRSTGQLAPGAPEELYAAIGAGGQVLMVDPVSDTVVVRLGPLLSEGYGFDDAARVVTEALRPAR